jgi:hypothetical protein
MVSNRKSFENKNSDRKPIPISAKDNKLNNYV